jgi:hypothetical protein
MNGAHGNRFANPVLLSVQCTIYILNLFLDDRKLVNDL